MIKWIGNLFGKLLILTGALLMSQMPLFMHYYTQQLAGRVSELQWQIDGFSQMASQTGKNLDQYVQKFLVNSDEDFRLQGQFMKESIDRWSDFSKSLNALQQATPWTKPFIFVQKLNWKIAVTTYESFVPGLNLSIEGVIYALIGMGLGSFIYFLLRQFVLLLTTPFKRISKQKLV